MSEDRLYLFGAPVQDRPAPVRRGAYSVATDGVGGEFPGATGLVITHLLQWETANGQRVQRGGFEGGFKISPDL